MKKILFLILAAVCVIQTAYAATADISVNIETRQVTVDVDAGGEAGKEVGIYITGKDTGELNFIAQDYTDYEGKAEFVYNNHGDSGFYKVKTVVDGIEAEDKEFAILSVNDEKDIINSCGNAAAIKEKLLKISELVYLNTEDYERLSEEKQNAVFENLTKSKNEVKNIKDVVDAFYSSVIMVSVKDDSLDCSIEDFAKKDDYLSCMGFDLLPVTDGKSVYELLNDTAEKDVLEKLASGSYNTAKDFKNTLPLLVLKEYLNTNSYWADCDKVIKAYYNAGLINIKYSQYEEKNNKNEIIETVRTGSFKDFREFETLFNSSLTAKDSSGKTSSSGGGGGGGGGSVSVPVVPVNPLKIPEEVKPESFADISEFSWAEAAIANLRQAGIISGTGDNMFEPARSITRAEAVKMFVTMFDIKDETAVVNFSDVRADDWSYVYIASAYKNEIVNGKTADIFGVNDTITREEMITIAYRLIMKYNLQYEKSQLTGTNFDDTGDISEWAQEAANYCRNYGIVIGRGDNCFDGKADVTRAEAAVILNNVYKAMQ